MSVRIGVSPILWYNDDDPSLGTDIPLSDCLDQVVAAGYTGIELGHLFPNDPGALRALLQRHGLGLVSGWYGSRLLERDVDAEVAAMRPHVALLKSAGCELIVWCDVSGAVHRTDNGLRGRPTVGDWSGFTRALDHIGNVLADEGMRLGYHHHMGTLIQTRADIDRLLHDTSDAVGLTLDTGHFVYAQGDGTELLDATKAYASRIGHVHLKDVRAPVLNAALQEDRPFLKAVADGVFTVPGDGSIGFDAPLQALRDGGYDGWFVVEAEQDPSRADPHAFATLGYRNTHALTQQAGFEA